MLTLKQTLYKHMPGTPTVLYICIVYCKAFLYVHIQIQTYILEFLFLDITTQRNCSISGCKCKKWVSRTTQRQIQYKLSLYSNTKKERKNKIKIVACLKMILNPFVIQIVKKPRILTFW